MPVPPLTYRSEKGSPLTENEVDGNTRTLADFATVLEARLDAAGVSGMSMNAAISDYVRLRDTSTGSIYRLQITDGVLSQPIPEEV